MLKTGGKAQAFRDEKPGKNDFLKVKGQHEEMGKRLHSREDLVGIGVISGKIGGMRGATIFTLGACL